MCRAGGGGGRASTVPTVTKLLGADGATGDGDNEALREAESLATPPLAAVTVAVTAWDAADTGLAATGGGGTGTGTGAAGGTGATSGTGTCTGGGRGGGGNTATTGAATTATGVATVLAAEAAGL